MATLSRISVSRSSGSFRTVGFSPRPPNSPPPSSSSMLSSSRRLADARAEEVGQPEDQVLHVVVDDHELGRGPSRLRRDEHRVVA